MDAINQIRQLLDQPQDHDNKDHINKLLDKLNNYINGIYSDCTKCHMDPMIKCHVCYKVLCNECASGCYMCGEITCDDCIAENFESDKKIIYDGDMCIECHDKTYTS